MFPALVEGFALFHYLDDLMMLMINNGALHVFNPFLVTQIAAGLNVLTFYICRSHLNRWTYCHEFIDANRDGALTTIKFKKRKLKQRKKI